MLIRKRALYPVVLNDRGRLNMHYRVPLHGAKGTEIGSIPPNLWGLISQCYCVPQRISRSRE